MSIVSPPSASIPTPPRSGFVEPEELLSMHGLFELADGRLIEKHMSFEAGDTAVVVILALSAFVRQHQSGKVVTEVTFQCFPDKPKQVRRPDIAFIQAGRLPQIPKHGHVPVRPDLAIEIVSPGDEVYELEDKLADYESAGIPLIWILNPSRKSINVIHPNQPTIKLRSSDQLDGEHILPGFSAKVLELFPV